MNLADLGLSPDLVATGGSGLVVAFLAIHLIRRTRETDDRRDDATKFAVELATTREALAFEREAKAWRERDDALAEARTARQERDEAFAAATAYREELELERARLDRILEHRPRFPDPPALDPGDPP